MQANHRLNIGDPLAFSFVFFALVFCTALVAGFAWGIGNLLAAKVLRP